MTSGLVLAWFITENTLISITRTSSSLRCLGHSYILSITGPCSVGRKHFKMGRCHLNLSNKNTNKVLSYCPNGKDRGWGLSLIDLPHRLCLPGSWLLAWSLPTTTSPSYPIPLSTPTTDSSPHDNPRKRLTEKWMRT